MPGTQVLNVDFQLPPFLQVEESREGKWGHKQKQFSVVHPLPFDAGVCLQTPQATLSRALLLICLWGNHSSSLWQKPPLEYKSSLEEPDMRAEAEPHSANRLSDMKEQLRHWYPKALPPYFPLKQSGGAPRWGRPIQRDWTTISPPPTHSPRQTSQESNSFISCVMGFYLKSTFNTGIVSQIQVFTLYSTKVFEYYSLYKMGPYKNTDNLMFLYSLL